jgi:hypothetical protein
MSKDGHIESRGRITPKSLVPSLIIGVASILLVLYLRIAPSWNSNSSANFVAAAPPIILMWIFYASALVSLANLREMQGTVSGWFDVLGLMVVEALLTYLVFANFLYVSVVIALCVLFVAYVNFAQSD